MSGGRTTLVSAHKERDDEGEGRLGERDPMESAVPRLRLVDIDAYR